MTLTPYQLSTLYHKCHEHMRNVDGLQPPEAFDELLKYMFLKEQADITTHRAFPVIAPLYSSHDPSSHNGSLAQDLRQQLRTHLGISTWSSQLWKDQTFNLSDTALLAVHDIFDNIDFSTIDIDTRSNALNRFFRGEMRRGLGIFPTPDNVAKMMVNVASPSSTSKVLDPACGTGTFLIEVIRHWNHISPNGSNHHIWGIDKSPRMLLLSELNLSASQSINYKRTQADSLYESPTTLFSGVKEGFDLILTNPPFGVVIDHHRHDMTQFLTCRDSLGKTISRQQSEVVFVEQCLKYLKPGGLLGIVLPRSIVTNTSLGAARKALNSLGYVETIVNLPPETFSGAGTQTNTVVLFLRRFKSQNEKLDSIRVASVDIQNVGFDATGRPRRGDQLMDVSDALRAVRNGHSPDVPVRLLPKIAKIASLVSLPDMLSGRTAPQRHENVVPLQELVELAGTGRTPGRAHYASDGLFLVKVGNLTGHGINWKARERNFVSGTDAKRRRQNRHLMLGTGDILLTSSAHSPVYIARKVDIVAELPQWLRGEASFVGEVMRLRTKRGIDPYVLLAYLRLPTTQQKILNLVRGQTAHLHPRDILAMSIPKVILNPPPEFQALVDRIREESFLYHKINELVFEQNSFFAVAEELLGCDS